VHLQDLIKAHAGNADVHPNDPTKIHWAKFNMMGKFIQSTMEFQVKCKNSVEYHFRETREHAILRQLLMRECKMDLEVCVSWPLAGRGLEANVYTRLAAKTTADAADGLRRR
jgi:hypothetical protein